MKVIVKKPNMSPEVIDVESISDINKLCHNIDNNGEGYPYTTSDICDYIGNDIIMFCKEDAINNFSFEQNMWNRFDSGVIFGNVVFVSESHKNNEKVCSLNDEQIEIVKTYISQQNIAFDVLRRKKS